MSAGAWVRFLPKRVEVAAQISAGFDIDTTRWRKYRLVNSGGRLTIWADGEKRLEVPVKGIYTREVRFGNRPGRASRTLAGTEKNNQSGRQPLRGIVYEDNAGLSLWRSIRASIRNRRDHSVEWSWSAKDGFPDQFRRDRILTLERNGSFALGDSGYSSWDELPDGSVVAVDYTSTDAGRRHPLLRSYRFKA